MFSAARQQRQRRRAAVSATIDDHAPTAANGHVCGIPSAAAAAVAQLPAGAAPARSEADDTGTKTYNIY